MQIPLADSDLSGNAPPGFTGTPDAMYRHPAYDMSGDTARADIGTQDAMYRHPAPDMSGEKYPVSSASSPDLPCIPPDVNLKDFHGYADALKNEGDACYQEGEYHEAIYFYDVALGINPDFEPAWNNKGLTLVKLGRVREAQDCLDEVRRLRQRPAIRDTGIPGEHEPGSPSERARS